MKKLRLMTAISANDAQKFVDNLELKESSLCNLDLDMYNCIKDFISTNTGFDEGCVVCVQKIDNESVTIEQHFDDLCDYVPASTGSVILEMLIDNDMVTSLDFMDYITFNRKFKSCKEVEKEYLERDLENKLKIGEINDEEVESVISFIPIFYARECTKFLILNEDWDGEEMELAGIPPVHLKRLQLE